jgi:hypothetical protein
VLVCEATLAGHEWRDEQEESRDQHPNSCEARHVRAPGSIDDSRHERDVQNDY